MDAATLKIMHKTIKKVTGDVDELAFNTAISQLMVYSNHLQALDPPPAEPVRALALLLSPFAPHLGEEMWQMLGGDGSLAYAPWPTYDEALCAEDEVTLAVQVVTPLEPLHPLSPYTPQALCAEDEVTLAVQIHGKGCRGFGFRL